jgi:large subunit ribosomal protein L3
MKGILGKKVGMTQVFDAKGVIEPVTIIEAGPCFVVQKRTVERDGYSAVQIGFEAVKESRLNKPLLGHLKHAGLPPLRYLRELKLSGHPELNEGEKIDVGVFTVGDHVDIVGTSKGKGFQGGMKRHGFSGGPATHGQSDRQRSPGSIGAGTTPGRVMKGSHMAGRMGNDQVSAQNLEVILVDPERNLIAVKGSVPGAAGGLLIIKEARKTRGAKKVRR